MLREPQNAREPGPYARWPEHDDHHEGKTVERSLDTWRVDAKPIGQRGEHLPKRREDEGTHHRPEHGAESTDDRRQDDLDRAVDVEHAAREQVVAVEGGEHAADRGQA